MFIKLLRQRRSKEQKPYIKRENDGITIKDIIAGCIRISQTSSTAIDTRHRGRRVSDRDIELTSTNGLWLIEDKETRISNHIVAAGYHISKIKPFMDIKLLIHINGARRIETHESRDNEWHIK